MRMDVERLNASLTRSSSYRKCSKRRILGHSAQATSLLPIEGTTKCSRKALGFGFGSGMGSVVEPSPQSYNWVKEKANLVRESNTAPSKYKLRHGKEP